ncbi:response regulator transcription factor [Limobrevibacterium gyesilva]|uniref:Response regulator transcription factor n=1 Tax=Limobrevibacterium gyesilva TaxID=2991712 RepID=A0AA41YQS5_9PROT|nr:response regulator transcription factor [Limobrevibacterium gyesilva]MCW3474790.1 response regulator transcription factor [Limobrevibacterium gyesilva]
MRNVLIRPGLHGGDAETDANVKDGELAVGPARTVPCRDAPGQAAGLATRVAIRGDAAATAPLEQLAGAVPSRGRLATQRWTWRWAGFDAPVVDAGSRRDRPLRLIQMMATYGHRQPAPGSLQASPILVADRAPRETPSPPGESTAKPNRLLVVERREFVRGCLTCWLNRFCQEFEVTAGSDAVTSFQVEALKRAAAVILGVDKPVQSDEWLEAQIAWLRANCPELPIVVIVDADEARGAEDMVVQLGLQGYIPTSNNVEVAAAALRLVVAGGGYFPRLRGHDRPQAQMLLEGLQAVPDSAIPAKLTPREKAVLDLLRQGTPNKLIAFRLGMSLSTVKAHVHNIIRKLRVRNRTEVVVATGLVQAGVPSMPAHEAVIALPARVVARPQRGNNGS